MYKRQRQPRAVVADPEILQREMNERKYTVKEVMNRFVYHLLEIYFRIKYLETYYQIRKLRSITKQCFHYCNILSIRVLVYDSIEAWYPTNACL